MKTIDIKNRKELIDFGCWLNKGYPNSLSMEQRVDKYLESINSVSNETRAISKNEQTKEGFVTISSVTCPHCGKYFDNIYDTFHACSKT